MELKEIKYILKRTQEELKDYASKELQKYKFKSMVESSKYIYAVGDIPILLVAHLDIVHKNTPNQIFYDKLQKVMWSPTGIGGDDRCGVIAIIELLRQGYLPSVLFTTDEEIGCVGAAAFCHEQNLQPVRFALEIDRRGKNQAVFYDCGNKDLQEYITEKFGFELEYGSFTDVCELGETFDIGIVNLSAGYNNEHTPQEYINLNDLAYTINKVKEILEDEDETYYDYKQEICYQGYYGYWNCYDNKKDNKKDKKYTFLEEEDWEYLTKKEWLELYGYEKPKTKVELYQKLFNY